MIDKTPKRRVYWSSPNYEAGRAYSETGQVFVQVGRDGSLTAADARGVTITLPAGAAHAVLACLARAKGGR